MNTAQFVYDIASSYDAFGRLRISEPYTIFNSKLLYDKQPLIWDEIQISGSNTDSTYNSNEAAVTLTVSSNIPGARVRQTYERFNYQPGKSQFVMMTGILGSYSNDIIRRIGVFDCNNGLFFQSGPDNYYIVKRSSVTGTPIDVAIPQSQWNKNKLDSQAMVTFDFNKANIFYFNYEWLGVGDICCGVVIGKKYIQLHQFFHTNENNNVSFSKPNLPLRYEIINLGSGPTASLKCICGTVMSEGGQQGSGYLFSIDRDGIPLTVSANDTFYPLITIRLKQNRESVNVYLEGINIVTTTTNATFRWGIYLNPTFAGNELIYISHTNGNFEYVSTNTNGTTITGGTLLYSGYGIGTNATILTDTLSAKRSIGVSISGVSNIICLAIQRLDNQNDTFYAAMLLRESV